MYLNYPNRFFIGTAVLVLSLMNYRCTKDSSDPFCEVLRAAYRVVSSEEGVVVYSDRYNRYGISLPAAASGNIDAQEMGYACDLPQELRLVGTPVLVSGTLKTFNPDENIQPSLGGQEVYFLEVAQVAKR